MHVNIGSISDAKDDKGHSFKVYNFYLNGTYHCSLRYSQLLDFHNQLKSKYSMTQVTPFPPKRLRISDIELLERRGQLEKYIHCVLQDNEVGASSDVNDFLLAAQLASSGIDNKSTELEVFLCNGRSTTVSCSAYDSMPRVLETLASSIGLEPQFTYYFRIMLEYSEQAPTDSDDATAPKWKLLRAMRDFEAPYISLSVANTHSTRYKYRLALRKWFFEPSWITPLLESSVALNMLYIEVVSDLEGKEWVMSEENRKTITALKKAGKRKKCVELASTMVGYGYWHCGKALLSEEPNSKEGALSIGGLECVLTKEDTKGHIERKPLPISKMRSWRVGVLNQTKEHFISIEYERSRNTFDWVVFRGVSTILFTQCLNEAVHEFILKRSKKHVRKPGDVPVTDRPSISIPLVQFSTGFPAAEDIDPVVLSAKSPDETHTRTHSSSSSSQNDSESPQLADGEQVDGASKTTDRSSRQPDVSQASNDDDDDEVTTSKGHAAIAGIGSALSKVATGIKGLKLQGLGSGKSKQQEQESLNPTFVSDDDL